MNKKTATLVAIAIVAVVVGVKFSAKLRPQLARIPVLGKYLA